MRSADMHARVESGTRAVHVEPVRRTGNSWFEAYPRALRRNLMCKVVNGQ